MPRIYASNNDPYDFCQRHFPKTEAAGREEYGNKGDGPDGRGDCFEYDACHPHYESNGYKCCECGKELTEADQYKS